MNPSSLSRSRSLALIDGCGRTIDHLRMSVTSACDLRCLYCSPDGQANVGCTTGTLTDEQRIEFVRFLHERHGLTRVRITGGEPLLYRGVVRLVAALRQAVPDVELAMTTSGRLLYQRGFDLFQAGLDRLNISLDSLRPERYRHITGTDIEGVLRGIESAKSVGFRSLRINTVVLRGVNDDEIVDLAAWALTRGLEIRFLEAMPIGPATAFNRQAFVSGAEIEATLATRFQRERMTHNAGETARRFRATCETCSGVIGLITPVSQPFCTSCRRMRLTAEGLLYPCLLDSRSVDMRPAWRDGGFAPHEADTLIRSAVAAKRPNGSTQAAPMVTLGG
ncbi:MAG: GTP 3',8-cyclase MoaA [Planctomycetes bacterium]|nr:GTP 3',8-cyclase MoaA [Planctomycetota bacterium]